MPSSRVPMHKQRQQPKVFSFFVRLRRREWVAKVRVGPDTDTKVLAFRQTARETPITFSRARNEQHLDRARPIFRPIAQRSTTTGAPSTGPTAQTTWSVVQCSWPSHESEPSHNRTGARADDCVSTGSLPRPDVFGESSANQAGPSPPVLTALEVPPCYWRTPPSGWMLNQA
ncbi:hypothetical protein D3C76_260190 [compost metagenome]